MATRKNASRVAHVFQHARFTFFAHLGIARAIRFLFESPDNTGAFLLIDGGYRFGI